MLTDEEIDALAPSLTNALLQMSGVHWRPVARAIETAATAPLLERIAALEAKLAQRVPEKITEDMHVAAVKVLHRASGVDGLPQRMLDAMRSAAPAAPERQEPDCPRCGNNRQVWTNQISGEKTCHRVDCHTVVPLTQEEIAEAESDRAIPSGRVFNIRAAFEDWYSDGGKYPKAVECKPGDPLSYILLGAQSSWGAWFAGVKALEAWIAEGQAPNAQQAEAQEPAYWQWRRKADLWSLSHVYSYEVFATTDDSEVRTLFTRPQPAQLQALSEEEIVTAWRGVKDVGDDKYNAILLSEAIQSALAAKNGVVLK